PAARTGPGRRTRRETPADQPGVRAAAGRRFGAGGHPDHLPGARLVAGGHGPHAVRASEYGPVPPAAGDRADRVRTLGWTRRGRAVERGRPPTAGGGPVARTADR